MELDMRAGSRRSEAPRGGGRSALFVAHPGHELCVYGWLKTQRPIVYVLTDGSGPQRPPRLGMTERILGGVGARPGGFYGVTTDEAVYAALFERDVRFFNDLARQLSESFLEDGVTQVVSESAEGYNVTHDLARAVAGAAVRLANRRRPAAPLGQYEFDIVQQQDSSLCEAQGCVGLRLDEKTLAEKIGAARSYPELAEEVGAALDHTHMDSLRGLGAVADEIEQTLGNLGGAERLRTECLHPATGVQPFDPAHRERPFYERHGEALVAAGRYASVIRYREHYLPIVEGLRTLTEESANYSRLQSSEPGRQFTTADTADTAKGRKQCLRCLRWFTSPAQLYRFTLNIK